MGARTAGFQARTGSSPAKCKLQHTRGGVESFFRCDTFFSDGGLLTDPVEQGSERLYPAPASEEVDEEAAQSSISMARREGLLVPLRGPAVPPGSVILDLHCSHVAG